MGKSQDPLNEYFSHHIPVLIISLQFLNDMLYNRGVPLHRTQQKKVVGVESLGKIEKVLDIALQVQLDGHLFTSIIINLI